MNDAIRSVRRRMRSCVLFLLLVGVSMSSGLEALEAEEFGGGFRAFVGGDVGKPGVIVLQEWWGVTDQVKEHAEKIADGGYRVLVPDLYKGKTTVDKEEASHLMSNLDFMAAIEEVGKAAEFLSAEGSTRIGVIGFCMGGALALGSVAKHPLLVAAAPFYGMNLGLFSPEQLKNKAIQGHFGREDNLVGFSDVTAAEKLQAVIKEYALSGSELFIYDKVGHAFLNPDPAPFKSFEQRQQEQGFPPYDKNQASLAWSRVFAFFDTFLKQDASGKAEL